CKECEHDDVLYFKYSKKTKNTEIIDFSERQREKQSQINEILRSRVICPRADEHKLKKKDHKYLSVRSYGNTNRQYCICHESNKRNRYEFIFDNKSIITIRKFLEVHSYELYEKLFEIYSNIGTYKAYDYIYDKYRIIKLLFKIGYSDEIIAKLLGTNQTKINRIKRKNEYKKVTKIRATNSTNSYVFKWKIKDVSQYDINALHTLLKKYGFKITSEIKSAN
ncbi:hypothetical protein, partial [Poseidonibacter sp.]|uniref:hypothetical protein n=1 Tax=Poseidonibacter sp. TaxID=2321188 RepID=UPI003C715270